LSKPISSLIAGVAELGKGKLGYRFSDIDPDLGPVKEALNDMAGRLQETIVTRDTFNAQLQGANKELESFAYSVAHDLRAPLRAVDGFSQALAEDCGDQLDEKAKKYLTHLRQGAQEMGGLIDDMLTLSRATRGDLNFQQTDISSIAQRVAENLQKSEPDRSVAIRIQPDISAWCDQRMVKIVFENLLGNAWKYTCKTEKATISLTLNRQDETTIEFCIADNGAGFNNEYADKLFEPFQRLHRKDEFPGSGIGLSTVQRIAQRLGGKVRGEGQVNAGARFYLTLLRKGS
jgi:light-regulated signal transduction histidine kinase (bacteriophytochrome)